MDSPHRSNIFVAAFWMVAISLALFFMPLLNGVIGGAVGGYKAGTPGRGIMAALLPALIVGGLLWMIMSFFDRPVLGFFGGTAASLLVLLADIGLFIGALIGGYFAGHRGTAGPRGSDRLRHA